MLVVGPRCLAIGVGDRVDDERKDAPIPGREIGRRGMDEAVAEDQRRARRTGGRDDAAFADEPGNGIATDAPQRIARRLGVERGRYRPPSMRARDEPERPVELADVVEEDMKIEGERRCDAILLMVSGEIIVPLPDLAFERGLGVDLDLLDIELLLAEELERRLDQPRMAHQPAIDGVTRMQA